MRASRAWGFSVEVIESKFARRSAVRSSAWLDVLVSFVPSALFYDAPLSRDKFNENGVAPNARRTCCVDFDCVATRVLSPRVAAYGLMTGAMYETVDLANVGRCEWLSRLRVACDWRLLERATSDEQEHQHDRCLHI